MKPASPRRKPRDGEHNSPMGCVQCGRGCARGEIGAIRIGQAETYFQIPRALADKYAATAARTGQNEGEEEVLLITAATAQMHDKEWLLSTLPSGLALALS